MSDNLSTDKTKSDKIVNQKNRINDDHSVMNGTVEASRKMVLLKVIIISLFALLFIIASFITYLQFATFDHKIQGQNFEELYQRNKESVFYNKGFTFEIPEEVIATEVRDALIEDIKDSKYGLTTVTYSKTDQTFDINFSYMGFYVPPLSIKADFIKIGDEIVLKASGFKIGKHRIGEFWPLDQIIKGGTHIYESFNRITLSPNRLNTYENIAFAHGKIEPGFFDLTFTIDFALIQSAFDILKSSVDPVLQDAYDVSENLTERKASEWIKQVYPLSDDQVNELINDLLGNQILTRHLMVLAGEASTNTVTELLSQYDIVIDRQQINLDRKVLEGKSIDPLAIQILEALDAQFSDQFIAYNQGKPFDIAGHNTITITELIEIAELDVEESLRAKLSFVLKNGFGVAYQIDDVTYYIRYMDGYEVVGKTDFEAIEGSGVYVEPELVNDTDLWEAIESPPLKTYFGVETVFIRYMKSDGKSAFVVASPEDDPQQYWNFALYKDETFVIIEDNVQSLMDLYSQHPYFNIETGDYEIETLTLLRIDDAIHETILIEMNQIGKIGHPSNHSIIFSSYDGKYISFVLENGNAYVYKVEGTTYGTYLTTVYDKEKAIRNWPDMPKLITLQDKPE